MTKSKPVVSQSAWVAIPSQFLKLYKFHNLHLDPDVRKNTHSDMDKLADWLLARWTFGEYLNSVWEYYSTLLVIEEPVA